MKNGTPAAARNPSRREFALCVASSVATTLGLSGPASAQGARPTRIVVGYAPGGGTDILARHLAEALTAVLGHPVIVENKPGAGGNIAAEFVAKSAADGLTLLMGDSALAVNPSLFKKLAYDPLQDFVAVAPVGTAPLVLLVDPRLKAKSVKDLVALAKSRPGELSYATPGKGSPPHLAGALFQTVTRTQLLEVPYRGMGPALTDLMGGQVSMLFTGLSSAQPQIEAGKVRALAVTGPMRARTAPDLPTLKEEGFDAAGVTSWWGLFAPAGTPAPVVEKIRSTTAQVLREPRLKGRLSIQAIETWEGSNATLSDHLKAETARWRKVTAEAGISSD